MNKRKALQQQNNHYEKQLPEETRHILTDIVVYLKSFPISEYQVELVRLDITRMLLEGAARGASASEVLGEDYKEFCKGIVAELPPRTPLQTITYHADILFLGLAILMPLWMVTGLLNSVQNGGSLIHVPVSSGTISATLIILVVSYAIVQYICKTSLEDESEQARRKSRFRFILILFFAVLVCMAPAILFRNTVLNVHIAVYIAGFVICFGIHKLLAAYTD